MAAVDGEFDFTRFEAQARRCEDLAADDPAGYRKRVALLAALGYAFPPAVLLVSLALFGGLIAAYALSGVSGGRVLLVKLGIALLLLVGMVLKAMWPSFSKPEGIRLKREEAPEFFAFLDDLRARAGNPKVHRVYLVDEMTAYVVQTPRLGLLGWHRNDLALGLPLLQALTREEVAAVVAHEFGHLSGAHGKLGAWVYRSHRLMHRILEAVDEDKVSGLIFQRFYHWYQPYFAAYSFALRREQEYEADRVSAEATSPRATVDALSRVSVAAQYMGYAFWPEVWQRAETEPDAPAGVYGRLGRALFALGAWEGTPKCLDSSLGDTTDYGDTHPSLTDRARALRAEPRVPEVPGETAVSLLPDEGAAYVEAFSRDWLEDAGASWRGRHEELEQQRQWLADLEAAAGEGPLAEEDALNRGFLAEKFMDSEAALERFRQALDWSGDADRPLYQTGRLLLELGRDEGIGHLDRLMARDEDAVVPACSIIESYLTEAGRTDEAAAYARRREAMEQMLETDWAERNSVNKSDTFVMHRYTPEQAAELARALAGFKKKGLKKAWLVAKLTTHRQSVPAHLLVCEIGVYRRWTEDMAKLQREIAQNLSVEDDLAVTVCDTDDGWIRDKAQAVSGAQIYPQA